MIPHVEDLDHVNADDIPSARRLLENLIRATKCLHDAGVLHNNIKRTTVLQHRWDHDRLFFIELTRAEVVSEKNHHRKKLDCLRVFRTVRECLGEAVDAMPPSWTGNPALDELWAQSSRHHSGWTATADEVIEIISARPSIFTSTSIEATKLVSLRHHHDRREGTTIWSAEDVRAYLAAAVTQGTSRSSRTARSMPLLGPELDSLIARHQRDGHLSYKAIEDISRHLQVRHGYALTELSDCVERGEHHAEVRRILHFRIPYIPHHGLFNVQYLAGIDPAKIESALRACSAPQYEIRGVAASRGLYLPADCLPAIAKALDLAYSGRPTDTSRRESLLDGKQGPDYYFATVDRAHQLFPVRREDGMVELPGTDRSCTFSEFLARYVPSKDRLDFTVPTRDASLIAVGSVVNSCTGSVSEATECSDARLQFKWKKRPHEVSEWIQSSVSKRGPNSRQRIMV